MSCYRARHWEIHFLPLWRKNRLWNRKIVFKKERKKERNCWPDNYWVSAWNHKKIISVTNLCTTIQPWEQNTLLWNNFSVTPLTNEGWANSSQRFMFWNMLRVLFSKVNILCNTHKAPVELIIWKCK